MHADVILIGASLIALAWALARGGAGSARVPILVWVLTLAGPAAAEPIYKSVDADGRVTYSTTPPSAGRGSAVEELRIHTGPTPVGPEGAAPATAQPPASEAGTKRPPESAASKQTSPAASALREAQQAVIQAKAELEQAKIHGPEDWQTTPNGDRVSTTAYDQRLAAAQAKVRAAEAALGHLRKP